MKVMVIVLLVVSRPMSQTVCPCLRLQEDHTQWPRTVTLTYSVNYKYSLGFGIPIFAVQLRLSDVWKNLHKCFKVRGSNKDEKFLMRFFGWYVFTN